VNKKPGFHIFQKFKGRRKICSGKREFKKEVMNTLPKRGPP